MIGWLPLAVSADVEEDARALLLLVEGAELLAALPAPARVAAISEFRRIRGRVPKPGTGPLVLPASDTTGAY